VAGKSQDFVAESLALEAVQSPALEEDMVLHQVLVVDMVCLRVSSEALVAFLF
jgi:hypothetical protein